MNVSPDSSWKKILEAEFQKPYFVALKDSVEAAYLQGNVFPAKRQIFHALELCPFEKTRVVVLGQDPYHGLGQAHGLSFSVPNETKIPPSLRNIYKEIANDVEKEIPTSGNLEHWATQGVLLLNTTLTVESGKPGSHQGLGWEQFTDAIIKTISDKKEHVVFLLWGKSAQTKAKLIDSSRHLILKAPHPSPFSAHTGFLGCKHFSKTNSYLITHDQAGVEW